MFLSSVLTSQTIAKRNWCTHHKKCNNIFNVWKICLKTDRRSNFAFSFLYVFLLTPKCAGKKKRKRRKEPTSKRTHKKYEKIRYNLWFVYSKEAQAMPAKKKKFFHSISSEWVIKYCCWYRPQQANINSTHNSGAVREWISEWWKRMKQHWCPVMRDLLTRFLNVYISFDMWFFRFWLFSSSSSWNSLLTPKILFFSFMSFGCGALWGLCRDCWVRTFFFSSLLLALLGEWV